MSLKEFFDDDLVVPDEGIICTVKLRETNSSDRLILDKGGLKPLDKLLFTHSNSCGSQPHINCKPCSTDDIKREVAKPYSYRSAPPKGGKIANGASKALRTIREIDSEKLMRVLLK